MLDRFIIFAIIIGWVAATLGYYQLFQSAANASSFLPKLGLLFAAFFAVAYSLITFVLVIVLPVNHIVKALRGSSE